MNKRNYTLICALFSFVVGCQNAPTQDTTPVATADTTSTNAASQIVDTSMTFEKMGYWYGQKICECGKSYFAYKEQIFEIEKLNLEAAKQERKITQLNKKYDIVQLKDQFWDCRMNINDSLFLNMKQGDIELDYQQQEVFDTRVLEGFDAMGCQQFKNVRQTLFQ